MKTLLADSSVVVAAHDVNLSIFNPVWLVKNGCLTEQELQEGVVVSPVVVLVPCKPFNLTIMPDRIQMNFPGPDPGGQDTIDRVIGHIVKTLPHTPFVACGLNLTYIITPSAGPFRPWCRQFFSSHATTRVEGTPLDDTFFGAYISFDALGGRLKLDMKPTRSTPDIQKLADDWEVDADVMRLNFNYHFGLDTQPDPLAAALRALAAWKDAVAHSSAIVDRLSK